MPFGKIVFILTDCSAFMFYCL